MTEKNPRAPKNALCMEDVKPGVEAVVIGGGRAHHEVVTFHSKPYSVTYEGVDMSSKPGDTKFVKKSAMKAKVSSGGKAVSTEITSRGDGASRGIEERFLSDMGFCPSPDFGWSGRYTVPLKGYDPEDHN